MSERTTILVSHANPEDNEIASWYAKKLRLEGYRVFLDVDSLPAGSDFWDQIQRVIRQDAAKILFLSSRASNMKPGTLDELALAVGVERDNKFQDFIVPVAIDDLRPQDGDVRLLRRNIVPSQELSKGLRSVLKALLEAGVPRTQIIGSTEPYSAAPQGAIVEAAELHLSNWFRLDELPNGAWVHGIRFRRDRPASLDLPGVLFGNQFVTFAEANQVGRVLPPGARIVRSDWALFDDPLPPGGLLRRQLHDARFRIVRGAVERACADRGMRAHEMSGRTRCYFFPRDLADKNRVLVRRVGARDGRRAVFGRHTSKRADGSRREFFWHYALSFTPLFEPLPLIQVRYHVLFSDDGELIWESDRRLHRARRSECSDWWNDDWRDRLIGSIDWLGAEGGVPLSLAPGITVRMLTDPIAFESDRSYVRASETGRYAAVDD